MRIPGSQIYEMLLLWGSLLWCIIACQSQTSSKPPLKKNVKVEAQVEDHASTTLSIDSGAAKGAQVVIPSAALNAGSQVSFDRIDPPLAFASALKADGRGPLDPASAAVSVTAQTSGKEVLAVYLPITLVIPLRSSASSPTSLRLTTLGEHAQETLCVLHLSTDGSLYVWRYADIAIDAGMVTLRSHHFGTFQLAYCGDAPLTDFAAAVGSHVAAPPPSAAEPPGSSYGTFAEYELEVDGLTYAPAAAQLCLVVGYRGVADSGEPTHNATASTAFSNAGASTKLRMQLNTFLLDDEAPPFIAVLTQAASATCDPMALPRLEDYTDFERTYIFYTNKAALNAGNANGQLGTGAYRFKLITVNRGIPDSANAAEEAAEQGVSLAHDQALCLRANSHNSIAAIPTGQLLLNTQALTSGTFADGSRNLIAYLPIGSSPAVDVTVSAAVGSTCSFADKVTFGHQAEPYHLNLSQPVNGIYYLPTVEVSTQIEPLRSLGDHAGLCVLAYPGTYAESDGTPNPAADVLPLAQWRLDHGSSSALLLPWDISAVSENGQPLYDFSVAALVDCLDEQAGPSSPHTSTSSFVIGDVPFASELRLEHSLPASH